MIDLKFYDDTIRLNNISKVQYSTETQKSKVVKQDDSYGIELEVKSLNNDTYYVLAFIKYDYAERYAYIDFVTENMTDMPYDWNKVMEVAATGVDLINKLHDDED